MYRDNGAAPKIKRPRPEIRDDRDKPPFVIPLETQFYNIEKSSKSKVNSKIHNATVNNNVKHHKQHKSDLPRKNLHISRKQADIATSSQKMTALLSAFIIVAGTVVYVVGMAILPWSQRYGLAVSILYGLFQVCDPSGCSYWLNQPQAGGSKNQAAVRACQALSITGSILSIVSVGVSLAHVFKVVVQEKRAQQSARLGANTAKLAGLLMFTSLIVWARAVHDNQLDEFGLPFIISGVGCGALVLGGFILFTHICLCRRTLC